jgi:pyruvate,orthophosphate dikinase
MHHIGLKYYIIHKNKMSQKKWIYFFGANQTEGDRDMKLVLGGKGAGLAEMCKIGVPVPPGFTIVTEACQRFNQNKKELWPELIS